MKHPVFKPHRASLLQRQARVISALIVSAIIVGASIYSTSAAQAATSVKQAEYSYANNPHGIRAFWVRKNAKLPAVILIHGGYWAKYDKSSFYGYAEELAKTGKYAVFSIDYRLNWQAKWPAQRTDVLNAIQFVKSHAKTWNVDKNKVLLIGSSAGGHLAVQAATYGAGRNTVMGAVAFSPPASPYRAYMEGAKSNDAKKIELRAQARRLLHCTPDARYKYTACWKKWYDSVAYNHASKGDAPLLLIFSNNEFVSRAHSDDLNRALERKGVPVKRIVRSGSGHAWGGIVKKDPAIKKSIITWLDQVIAGKSFTH